MRVRFSNRCPSVGDETELTSLCVPCTASADITALLLNGKIVENNFVSGKNVENQNSECSGNCDVYSNCEANVITGRYRTHEIGGKRQNIGEKHGNIGEKHGNIDENTQNIDEKQQNSSEITRVEKEHLLKGSTTAHERPLVTKRDDVSKSDDIPLGITDVNKAIITMGLSERLLTPERPLHIFVRGENLLENCENLKLPAAELHGKCRARIVLRKVRTTYNCVLYRTCTYKIP